MKTLDDILADLVLKYAHIGMMGGVIFGGIGDVFAFAKAAIEEANRIAEKDKSDANVTIERAESACPCAACEKARLNAARPLHQETAIQSKPAEFPTLHRYRINQPSEHDQLRAMHGTRVLAHAEPSAPWIMRAYFMDGGIHSMQIPRGWLMDGWGK